MEQIKRAYTWIKCGDSTDPKHRGWAHPMVVGIITIVITLSSLRYISAYVVQKYQMNWEISDTARYTVGTFLLLYYLFLIFGRATFMSSTALYDMLWTCNVTMLVASIGFFLKDPVMMASAFSTILVDQALWYIDVTGFLVLRKWPIGVAKYLTWKETPLLKKLTSTHHLWFEPLCFSQLNVI
eukprot:TRINITY_DN477_c0_g1_i2.p2 TRINITY_DN477_c0_g1~~TRINITY_DN477_c0_g1_i2.p2  ORF type:complete len:183 (-),score=4.75 TRINITY_DN477_c0_g1_i2:1269-1817(-)